LLIQTTFTAVSDLIYNRVRFNIKNIQTLYKNDASGSDEQISSFERT